MKNFLHAAVLAAIMLLTPACNYITYTPHSRRSAQREKPSVILLNRIVDFRMEQQRWPFSKEDFISAGKIYKEAFDGFRYLYTRFKVIDENKMTFYFSSNISDVKKYDETQKADLNSYSGSVKFYKRNDQFLWKLRMN